jgi:hypothetical protein
VTVRLCGDFFECESDTVVSNLQKGLLRENKCRRTTAGVPVPAYQQFRAEKRASLQKDFQNKGKTHPDAVPSLAGCTPRPVGESEEWAAVITAAEDNLESHSVALQGKTLYSALYGNYAVALNELKCVLKYSSSARQPNQGDDFQEVRSRKR